MNLDEYRLFNFLGTERVSLDFGLIRTFLNDLQALGYTLPQHLPHQKYSSVNSTDAADRWRHLEFKGFDLPPLSATYQDS